MRTISVNVDVDVDLFDVIESMNRYDKRRLYDDLRDDLGIEDLEDKSSNMTPTESELFDICNKIYDNKTSLTNEDIDLLRKLSKKGWNDKISV
jgi:hypothetical protein